MKASALTLVLGLAGIATATAAPLHFTVYNPGGNGIFPVSSTLVTGQKDAVLFDAQFSVKDGEQLVKLIHNSGKKLTRIVITAGDPDYYFGLEPLVKAFPGVSIVATPRVVSHIRATQKAKLAYWGPKMQEGAPGQLFTPQVIPETRFTVEDQPVEIRDAGSQQAYVWFPAEKTLLGGTAVDSGIHVWTADTQTPQSRKEWRETLKQMLALHPRRVIPGHYLGKVQPGDQAVSFTLRYLEDFERALQQHHDAASLTQVMEKAWPNLGAVSSLELSAKVNTGEMKWP